MMMLMIPHLKFNEKEYPSFYPSLSRGLSYLILLHPRTWAGKKLILLPLSAWICLYITHLHTHFFLRRVDNTVAAADETLSASSVLSKPHTEQASRQEKVGL